MPIRSTRRRTHTHTFLLRLRFIGISAEWLGWDQLRKKKKMISQESGSAGKNANRTGVRVTIRCLLIHGRMCSHAQNTTSERMKWNGSKPVCVAGSLLFLIDVCVWMRPAIDKCKHESICFYSDRRRNRKQILSLFSDRYWRRDDEKAQRIRFVAHRYRSIQII